MSIKKKPYEISLWEDTLVFVGKSGENYINITEAKEEIVAQYYKETRLCTIGSDSMESPARAVNGKLVRKVNGEVTFTFTVYYRYYDNQTGQLEYNPFVPYLTNERKVKLKYDGEWYDLIIKQVQENSESKAFTYTCKSQFINELSKTGFELEFDNELENNMGTVEYLAEQILEGSDWVLEGDSKLKQFIEEPLYKVKIKSDAALTIKVMNPIEDRKEAPSITGEEIYVFYSHVNEQQKSWQFLYDKLPFSTNDDLVINKDIYPNYLIESVTYTEGADWPDFAEYGAITSDYRGMRLVKQARTIYDAKIDKYVQEYTKPESDNPDKIYYGFEETKYLSPNAVNNLIVNPNAFTSTTGWYTQGGAVLGLESDPAFNAENIGDDIKFTSYLCFPNDSKALINSSINGHKSSLTGFVEGETTYILRLKCKSNKTDTKYIKPSKDSIQICQYKDMSSFEKILTIFNFEEVEIEATNEKELSKDFVYYKATCSASITEKGLKSWDNYYGLFLNFDTSYGTVYIEDIQLFPYVITEDNKLCVPGGELFAKVETIKRYYDPSQVYSSLEEIEFESSSTDSYLPKYADGAEAYTKVSSITAKESNRFNLLQDLNEKFECWARFRVEHNPDTGEILYGKDIGLTGDEAYRQQKFISFHEYAGEHNHVGFKYGINSKSIQRTLDSNAIVSKMIVKNNVNEFAPNGFCSIARATDNSSKENFILNFDHYYRHNLLDLDVVTNDLYVDGNGYLGYYKKLREINQDRDALIDEQANLLKEIANYEAQYQTYKTSHDSALEERNQMEDNIFLLIVPKDSREIASGLDFPEIISTYSAGWEDNSSYIKYTTSWMQCDNVIKQHLPLYQKAESYLHNSEDRYKIITEELEKKTEQKRALNLQFYKKYSRFIQEGSWIKEDYIDDNLYYLDSLSTLHTSAQPKVTYNISVVDVSPLPGYEDYQFDLGDITYIEDREFFGYSLIDGTTPYREEIVVSEITTELDAPEKNSIKVQNYKTQFEDLFQRITAQTQQAEYHTGEYQRAASVIEPGGNISAAALENSFASNSFKLSNARDQSVVIDSSGITTTSLANPSEMLRIVNGGIFMSTDGGQSWKTGLTGYGLNSSYLTAGQINTDEIYIMSGSQPAFGWDEKGISAYKKGENYYDLNTCVRFDQYGIYGIKDNVSYDNIDAVMQSAPFALTWNGFSLKNDDGSVKITSIDDIQVLDNEKERIKIGRIDSEIYGIRISNAEGAPVMETDSTGELWLKNRLRIGVNDETTVEIGYLKETEGETEGEKIHKVISAGQGDTCFEVYEDGTMIARGATFKGEIIATSGTFNGEINATGGSIGRVLLSQNGITVNGAGFEVLDKDKNKTLYLDDDKGALHITGIIEATSASFKSGQIGGFDISEDRLVSQSGDIVLDGIESKIWVKEIHLGENAQIDNYIKLGEAYIRNPSDKDNPVFIESKSIKIFDNGKANFGEIEINGEDSKISGRGFYIKPDEASFDNVTVRGKISTSIFEKGSSQMVGGAFLFLDSVKITSKKPKLEDNQIVGYEYNLEEKINAPEDTWIWVIDKNSQEYTEMQIKGYKNGGQTIIVGREASKIEEPEFVVLIGGKNSLIMGINSSNSSMANGALLKRGLTVREWDNDYSKTPQLFLGDLSSLSDTNYSGYGLYSDNVYLKGSLTTLSSSGKSAGINTKSGITGSIDIVGNDSPIIFWAGSSGMEEQHIRNAPFQVTEDGYIYAKQAKLEGSVFANGEIVGTTLKTAKIIGWEQQDSSSIGKESALSVYGTSNGIGFYDNYEAENQNKVFSIGSDGFVLDSNNFNFISLKDNQVKFTGNIFQIGQENEPHLLIKKEDSSILIQHIHSSANNCVLCFGKEETSYEINGQERFKIDTTSSVFSGIFSIKGKNEQMEYRPIEGGYDLYVVYNENTL